jgi:hypothetical protein
MRRSAVGRKALVYVGEEASLVLFFEGG